jgi:threonine dehydratase
VIQETLDVHVEPAGAAGIAALTRHGDRLPKGRAAVILTGADAADAGMRTDAP